MSETSNSRARRRSERAQQLYNARMMPEDTANYGPASVSGEARPESAQERFEARYTPNEPTGQTAPVQPDPFRAYDESLFTPNEPTGQTAPAKAAPAYDLSLFTPNEPTGQTTPAKAAPAYDLSMFTPNEPTGQTAPAKAAPAYDLSMFTPNEPTGQTTPAKAAPAYDLSMFTPNEPTAQTEPAQPEVDDIPAAEAAPELNSERTALAANLSAYYRRAANVAAQENTDPFARLEWPPKPAAGEEEEDPAANVNVYRMQEASWAQEERQTMLSGEDADGYQVKTEERRAPGKRRRKKRLMRRVLIGVGAAVAVILVLALLGKQEPQTIQEQGGFVPVVTTTPQPIRGYDAAPAMAVSGKTDEAIDQISGPVEMATCAVTDGNVLTRSMRADGLFDYYLFASDGRLLAYFDKLPADGMFPMKEGGFYTAMRPYLVSQEGTALISIENLEQTIGNAVTLRPLMNGWARVIADDGESNLINKDGQLLSRLWFSRSFPMTGTESVAYVDTGVEGSATRYTLYVLDGKGAGNAVKWRDAADDQGVVTCALGMAYLQSGELYQLSRLLENPAAEPLCLTANVRFYTDCAAMVVQDPATGKYALYVNGERHYDYVYDSILPVESDVRWQGDILPGSAGQAMVLTVTGASYPQPLSHYFVLTRGATEEYVALSAVTNCPILLD